MLMITYMMFWPKNQKYIELSPDSSVNNVQHVSNFKNNCKWTLLEFDVKHVANQICHIYIYHPFQNIIYYFPIDEWEIFSCVS